jgi:hypothetical protein
VNYAEMQALMRQELRRLKPKPSPRRDRDLELTVNCGGQVESGDLDSMQDEDQPFFWNRRDW